MVSKSSGNRDHNTAIVDFTQFDRVLPRPSIHVIVSKDDGEAEYKSFPMPRRAFDTASAVVGWHLYTSTARRVSNIMARFLTVSSALRFFAMKFVYPGNKDILKSISAGILNSSWTSKVISAICGVSVVLVRKISSMARDDNSDNCVCEII
jgi:hypothetical protein